MKRITVKIKTPYTYHLVDGEFVCAHDGAYIEKACCTSAGSSGYIECGCGGLDHAICPNDDCPGLDAIEATHLIYEAM